MEPTIPFELEQIKGAYKHTERLSMSGMLFSKGYGDVGMETTWPEMSIHAGSARVAASGHFSELLADLSMAIVCQHARRNLTFTHGMPRRQVMLLDDELQKVFIEELRNDLLIHEKIGNLDFVGHESYMSRSVFNLVAVRQIYSCLKEDGFLVTARTPERVLISQCALFDAIRVTFPWGLFPCLTELFVRAEPYSHIEVPRVG